MAFSRLCNEYHHQHNPMRRRRRQWRVSLQTGPPRPSSLSTTKHTSSCYDCCFHLVDHESFRPPAVEPVSPFKAETRLQSAKSFMIGAPTVSIEPVQASVLEANDVTSVVQQTGYLGDNSF